MSNPNEDPVWTLVLAMAGDGAANGANGTTEPMGSKVSQADDLAPSVELTGF
jgi:hypothetical protein